MTRERAETIFQFMIVVAFVGMTFLAIDRLDTIRKQETELKQLNETLTNLKEAIANLKK